MNKFEYRRGPLSSIIIVMLLSQSVFAINLTNIIESDVDGREILFLMSGQLSSNIIIDDRSNASIIINTTRLTKNYYAIQTQALLMPFEQFSLSAELGQVMDNSLNFQYGLGATYNTQSTIYGINQSHIYFERFGYFRNLSLWISNRRSITPLNLTFKGGMIMQKYIAEKSSPYKNNAIDSGFLDVSTRYEFSQKWQSRLTAHILPKGASVQFSLHYIFQSEGS